jgi:hypothetical protein
MGWIEHRTAEPQNDEPQNFEGWFRFAQSFIKIRQNTFLRYSTFMIRHSIFFRPLNLHARQRLKGEGGPYETGYNNILWNVNSKLAY